MAMTRPRPRLGNLFLTWLLLGIQSFGGGSSTFSLIHQAALKQRWMTEEEFVRTWAFVQIAPGINLLKLTVMLGYRLRGWVGIVIAMAGLLLPSATVTVLMTAGFTTIRNVPWIQAMMQGILPAAIGLSFAMAVQMAQPILTRAYREGWSRLGAQVIILVSAALLMGLFKLSPAIILLLSGAAAMGLLVVIPACRETP